MSKLDHRLRSLLRHREQPMFDMAEAGPLAAVEEAVAPAAEMVEVHARCANEAAVGRLEEAGMEIWSHIPGAYSVAAGRLPVHILEAFAVGESIEGVERLEASRALGEELDLARTDTRVEPLHTPEDPNATPLRGGGVIVGIIDGGIDYRHEAFRNDDGTSRILFLWDQRAASDGSGTVPFGRQYDKAAIDAALASGDPLGQVPHRDTRGHGTHVACIAAGNGRSNDDFRGVAPDADLIVVASRGETKTLGRSTSAQAAYQYIVDRAQGRPLVINQSQGMNGGGHCGESLLETAIDNLLRGRAAIAVKSAGNEQQWRIHAGGELLEGQTATRDFRVGQGNFRIAILEAWFDDLDTISIALQPPGEEALPFLESDEGSAEFRTQADNEVFIQIDRDADDTGDTLATIEISRGLAPVIRPGTWRLHLRGDEIEDGRFDVWIERSFSPRSQFQARFTPESYDETRTVSVPGTARWIIVAGSHITREPGAPVGQISNFSSHGPTRYGLRRPTLTAPGQRIIAARSRDSDEEPNPDELHTLLPGTSMAAPHVAGTIALLLERRGDLTAEQVEQILTRSARTDFFSESAPDDAWGSGKLDAFAAVELAEEADFAEVSNVRIDGTELAWETDLPTTATVRFNRSKRRLLLGRSEGSRTTLTADTAHEVSLADLDAGTYFCEILVFTDEGFRTTDDNGGSNYVVTVE